MDPAFKERVTAAYDGLAARYDTERGGFFGPVSDLLVRAAATAARLGLAQVGVEAGDAEDPAYPDGSFDAVLASNVMFLLADPERAARRYAALLRPGGVFAFSWNVAEDPAWVPVIAAMDDHAADGGFAGFLHRPPFDAVPAMEAMLRRAGYRGIGTTQRVAEVRYASPDAWWEASRNQAPALFWEKIPEPDLRAGRARASRCWSRCGRRTAACAAGSASATPGPLPPSAPAARPGCSRPGAASSTANPLNALRSAGYAMLLSLTSSAALKAGDSSRDLRSRCRFTVHWPGNPEASPCSHGMPCRSSVSGDAVPA